MTTSCRMPSLIGCLALAASLVMTSACSEGTATAFAHQETSESDSGQATKITLPNAGGEPVILDAPADRIVALDPASIDLALSMGIELTARGPAMGPPPQSWLSTQEIAFSHAGGPNREQLLASNADLILINPMYIAFAEGIANTTGAPVLTLDIHSIDTLKEAANTIAAAAGDPDLAIAYNADIDRVIEDAVARVPETQEEQAPTVLPLFGAPRSFFAVLPTSFTGELIEKLGGQVVSTELEEHDVFKGLAPVSMETIVTRNPDIVIVLDHAGGEDPIETLRDSSAWANITAVQTGRVHTLSDRPFVQSPGADFEASLDTLFDAIYPPSEVADGGEW